MKRLLFTLPALLIALAACDGAAQEEVDTTLDLTTTTEAVTTTTEGTTTMQEATTTTGEATTTTGAAEEATVVMENISFEPNEITISPGSTVTWTNQDQVSHTTTSEDDLWDSGTMGTGDSFSFTFEEPGTYAYICTIHPAQMQATVIVEG